MPDHSLSYFLVDDDQSLREVLTYILTKEGYEVLLPPRAKKPCQIIEKEPTIFFCATFDWEI
jgi:DNA-binding response OmpR family regulator